MQKIEFFEFYSHCSQKFSYNGNANDRSNCKSQYHGHDYTHKATPTPYNVQEKIQVQDSHDLGLCS